MFFINILRSQKVPYKVGSYWVIFHISVIGPSQSVQSQKDPGHYRLVF